MLSSTGPGPTQGSGSPRSLLLERLGEFTPAVTLLCDGADYLGPAAFQRQNTYVPPTYNIAKRLQDSDIVVPLPPVNVPPGVATNQEVLVVTGPSHGMQERLTQETSYPGVP